MDQKTTTMIENKITLIDAFNQFWTVLNNSGNPSLNHAGFTYFYFINVWNAAGRPNSFCRQNILVCAQLNISRPTLDRHRQLLQQCGLIKFSSAGSGDPIISYSIPNRMQQKMEREKENNITSSDVKKEILRAVNFTSDVTSGVTSDVTYKQSKSTEKEKEFLLVVISGEKKTFNFLKDFFLSDASIQLEYARLCLPRDFFFNVLEQWMIQNLGKAYVNLQEAKKHFRYWLPYYQKQNTKNHENKPFFTNRKNNSAARKTNSDYAQGL